MQITNAINNDQTAPNGGVDYTGTQGNDSLKDDAYTGATIPFAQPEVDHALNTPITVKEGEIKGEKIIFDLLIKEKLAHAIIIKDGHHYHINLDGEDLGSFQYEEDGSIQRFPQPKGASNDFETYFKPIEDKVKSLME